jgi:small subunit ribosomal protein S7
MTNDVYSAYESPCGSYSNNFKRYFPYTLSTDFDTVTKTHNSFDDTSYSMPHADLFAFVFNETGEQAWLDIARAVFKDLYIYGNSAGGWHDTKTNNYASGLSALQTAYMKDGKKSTVASLVYKAFDRIKKDKLDPIEVLHKAIENTAPKMEVRPRRVGGASYLVPTETRQARKLFLALNWIIKEARKRSNKQFKTFDHKLYAEIVDAASNQGGAVEKKANIEKLAEANRAFAHFKW